MLSRLFFTFPLVSLAHDRSKALPMPSTFPFPQLGRIEGARVVKATAMAIRSQ